MPEGDTIHVMLAVPHEGKPTLVGVSLKPFPVSEVEAFRSEHPGVGVAVTEYWLNVPHLVAELERQGRVR